MAFLSADSQMDKEEEFGVMISTVTGFLSSNMTAQDRLQIC